MAGSCISKIQFENYQVPSFTFRQYCSKTRSQMFLLVSTCHVGAPYEVYQHGISIQSSINLGKTFLSILHISKIADLILSKAVWILCF